MPRYDLFTIGHSNISSERFIAMLGDAEVNAVADVRSVPNSRWCPWFSAKALAENLSRAGITYATMGDTLGGRPRDGTLFRAGVVDYEAIAAQPEFIASLDRLTEEAARSRICLMCSEREPLDCHRCLLVARSLAGFGAHMAAFLPPGRIEAHPGIIRHRPPLAAATRAPPPPGWSCRRGPGRAPPR